MILGIHQGLSRWGHVEERFWERSIFIILLYYFLRSWQRHTENAGNTKM